MDLSDNDFVRINQSASLPTRTDDYNDMKLTDPFLVGRNLLSLKWGTNLPNSKAISYEVKCKGKMQDGTSIDITVEQPAKNMPMVMLQRRKDTKEFLFTILVKLNEVNKQSYEIHCTGEPDLWKCYLLTRVEAEKDTQALPKSSTSESSLKSTTDNKCITDNARTIPSQIAESESPSNTIADDESIEPKSVVPMTSKVEER